MKRFLVLVLFAAVALGLGCERQNGGGSGDAGQGNVSDLPVIRVFFSDEITPEKDLVAEAVSKIAAEKIGANVEFVMFGAGEYAEKIPLLLASNEKMDIGFDAGWMDYVSRSRKGAYYAINELLEGKNKALYDLIDPKLWQGVTVDGKIYGVPTYKEIAEQWVLLAESGFLAENGIDPVSIKSMEDAEVILEALKKDPEKPGFTVLPTDGQQNLYSHKEYDKVNDVAYVKRSEPTKIVNYFETQRYKDFVLLLRSWFTKGYIAQDVATLKDYKKYTDSNGNQIMGLNLISYTPYADVNWEQNYGVKVTPMPISPAMVTSGAASGSINAVYNKSANPELALDFLELCNTDAEVKNLIAFGISGEHYDLVDGKVRFSPDHKKKYSNQNWKTGNMFISHLLDGEPDDKYDKYMEFNEQAQASPSLGFRPDDTSISDKISACKGVIKEYAPLLNCGAVDPDVYLPRFISALKSAGSDEIVSELQKQYDVWSLEQNR